MRSSSEACFITWILTWRVDLSARRESRQSMLRDRMLEKTASANSAATSHQNRVATGWWVDTECTIPSMMSLVIHSKAIGSREATTRNSSPSVTTRGPDSQTIFRTGGTFRNAIRRSLQPPQNFACSAMGLLEAGYDGFTSRNVPAAQRFNAAH